jgi:hypothetical protein
LTGSLKLGIQVIIVTRPADSAIIVFDFTRMRPACVLLQAVMGGDTVAFKRHFGGDRNWLLAPTPGMKPWRGTEEQWERVAEASRGRKR